MSHITDDALGANIRAYWGERAQTYSNGVVGELSDERRDPWELLVYRKVADLVYEAQSRCQDPRAVDLGCGPGFFEVLLAQAGWQVDAVDGSSRMLSRARANVDATGLTARVSFWLSDFARLPFDDNTFDLAIARNVTWLMREPDATYAEWFRVLRPGGRLLVFDANWYRYLVDTDVDAQRRRDQATNVVEEWDEDSVATSEEERRCEELAANLPLTSVLRPAWDVQVLRDLGACDVCADEDVWRELWTPSEAAFYGSSPLFLFEATKERR